MASKSATASRIATAQQAIESTMAAIAAKLGIEMPSHPVGIPLRDPAIRAAYHTERVNAFLELVAKSIGVEGEPARVEPSPQTEESITTETSGNTSEPVKEPETPAKPKGRHKKG